MKISLSLAITAILLLTLFQNCSDGHVRLPSKPAATNLAIRAINPIRANQDDTIELTVHGENFDQDTTVQVGGLFCRDIVVQSSSVLTCIIGPVDELGTVDVKVFKRDGSASQSPFEWYELSVAEKCRLPEYQNNTQVQVNFAQQNNQCDFGNGGNGPAAQGLAQARVEQDFNLSLPADAAVCGITFNFPVQTFRYDDDIALTFGNVLLMTSLGQTTGNMTLLQGSNYLRSFNWNNMLGANMGNRTPYCAGQDEGFTTCTIPPSDQQANFVLNMDGQVFTDILRYSPNSENKFTFITIGDNDAAVDCQHSGLNFTANVQYVRR